MWVLLPAFLLLATFFVAFYPKEQIPNFAPWSNQSHVAAKSALVAASQIPVDGINKAYALGALVATLNATGKCVNDDCDDQFRRIIGPGWNSRYVIRTS